MNEYIDLRSDTVTKPCEDMRVAMAKAVVGDDVMQEDDTVNQLQQLAAEMLDKKAALFFPSGTQSNLCAIMAHCGRGDEYMCGQQAHVYKYEAGGAAVLGSVQPQPLTMSLKGELDLEQAQAAVKEDDFHYARTKLLCIENTHYGYALPGEHIENAVAFARKNRLSLHMDGARLFNASVHNKTPLKEIIKDFDSVSICLSKGLGAPIGSLLVGSKGLIDKARRIRKMVGGGMRQAGIVAAAGIYALKHNIDRLAEDHQKAKQLAVAINALDLLSCWDHDQQTSMVFVEVPAGFKEYIMNFMEERQILTGFFGPDMRLVMHKDITIDMLDRIIRAFRELDHSLKRQISRGI